MIFCALTVRNSGTFSSALVGAEYRRRGGHPSDSDYISLPINNFQIPPERFLNAV